MPKADRQRRQVTREIGRTRARIRRHITKGLERADDTFGSFPAAPSLTRVI